MEQRDKEHTCTGETVLESWIKSAAEFWSSMPGASNKNGSNKDPRGTGKGPSKRIQDSWQYSARMFQVLSSIMSDPDTTGSMFKGMQAMPEIFLRLTKRAWEGLFQVHRQYFEKARNMGRYAEPYSFEGLDQDIFKLMKEIYEREISQFFKIPQLGMTRFYQERVARAIDKYNIFHSEMLQFIHFLYLPLEKSLNIMQERLEKLANEGDVSENFQVYYDMWIKILEGHYMTLFKSPEYVQSLRNTINALQEFMTSREEILHDALKTLPVATNKDMDELYREIYELKKLVKYSSQKENK